MTKIIGLLGEAGAGKDTLAEYLCKHHGFEQHAIVSELKAILQRVYALDYEQLWGEAKEARDPRYNASTRQIMQDIGMAFRQFNPTVWIDTVLRQKLGPKVVISDVRLPNEVEKIRAAGGTIWRIEMPNNPKTKKLGERAQHDTESAQRSVPAEMIDATLINKWGDLPALYAQAETLLKTP